MTKPRGRTPSLISGSNGKPSLTTAGKERVCFRCKDKINKGDDCFEIPKTGGGFTAKKPCCGGCFKNILNQTKLDLEELEQMYSNK